MPSVLFGLGVSVRSLGRSSIRWKSSEDFVVSWAPTYPEGPIRVPLWNYAPKTILYTSTPQLPFKTPQIPSNRGHKAINRGTLGGLGIPYVTSGPYLNNGTLTGPSGILLRCIIPLDGIELTACSQSEL